jgi:hypothetical protein
VEFGTIGSWLVDVINISPATSTGPVARCFAFAGGFGATTTSPGRGWRTGRWHSRVSGHPEVLSELPAAALAEEIDTSGEGQIKAVSATSAVADGSLRRCAQRTFGAQHRTLFAAAAAAGGWPSRRAGDLVADRVDPPRRRYRADPALVDEQVIATTLTKEADVQTRRWPGDPSTN